jgi:hypothetical protein
MVRQAHHPEPGRRANSNEPSTCGGPNKRLVLEFFTHVVCSACLPVLSALLNCRLYHKESSSYRLVRRYKMMESIDVKNGSIRVPCRQIIQQCRLIYVIHRIYLRRIGVHEMKKIFWLLIPVYFFVLGGCGDQGPVEQSWGKMKGLEYIVGNMNDDSYSTGRTQEPRPNALGEPVHMTEFEGEFVWAEYAATWCKACTQQTPVTKRVEADLGEEIVLRNLFVIIVIDSKNYLTLLVPFHFRA